jgi:hypothetical protein
MNTLAKFVADRIKVLMSKVPLSQRYNTFSDNKLGCSSLTTILRPDLIYEVDFRVDYHSGRLVPYMEIFG